MNKALAWTSALSAAFGFAFGWWPLVALSIALSALSGLWPLAVALGILFDLVYGAPPGAPALLSFPATLAAVLLSFLRVFMLRYLRAGERELRI